MAPLLPSASDELSGNLENADVNLLSRGKFPVSSLGAWSTPKVRRPPHDHCAASNPRIGLTSPRALLAGVFTMGVRRKLFDYGVLDVCEFTRPIRASMVCSTMRER